MAEALPAALSWLDAKKHQAAADVAQAMQAPETIGPNIWAALRDITANLGRQEDTGDPVQNSRNAMMGFGVGPLSIHQFPGRGPVIPGYGVTELPMTPEAAAKFQPAGQPLDLARIKALVEALQTREKNSGLEAANQPFFPPQ